MIAMIFFLLAAVFVAGLAYVFTWIAIKITELIEKHETKDEETEKLA